MSMSLEFTAFTSFPQAARAAAVSGAAWWYWDMFEEATALA
jgi:hypothetical protein